MMSAVYIAKALTGSLGLEREAINLCSAAYSARMATACNNYHERSVLAFTVWSAGHNVYRAGNRGYTASMPLMFGIGLAPLFQWLVLPPVTVIVYRKIEKMLFIPHGSTKSLLRNVTGRGSAS